MDLKAERVNELICSKCGHHLDPSQYKPLAEIDCPKCGTPMTVPAVFETFLLTQVIGKGTSGIAFRAFDDQLHRQVALKVLKQEGDDEKIALDCIAEARALASLNHPGIVQIYSVGQFHGQHYFVMELLSGQTAEHYTKAGNLLSEAAAIELTLSIAEALAAAHRVGLVHMDVKPQNILFSRDGQPKVIDFGAARFAAGGPGGKVIGTPYYIAPEVARGNMPDLRSDIYNLGASLFHWLTGRPPFTGKDQMDVVKQRLKVPPPDPGEHRDGLHPVTREVVARMMAIDPDDRYADYDALVTDLQEALEVADDTAPEFEETEPAPTPSRGRPAAPTSGRAARPASPASGGRPQRPGEPAAAPEPADTPAEELSALAAATHSMRASSTSHLRPQNTAEMRALSGTAARRRQAKSSAGLFIGIAVAAAAVIILVVVLVMGGGDGGSESSGAQRPTKRPAPVAGNQPPEFKDQIIQAQGTDLGLLEAIDPDIADTLRFRIVGGDPNDAFALHPGTGRLTLAKPDQLSTGQRTAVLAVEVTDSGRPPQSVRASVTVRGLENYAPAKAAPASGPPGLRAHLTFNNPDNLGENAAGPNATVNGNPSHTQDGRLGGAILMDGNDDEINLPPATDDFREGMTLAVWAYPTANQQWARFFDIGDGPAKDNVLLARENNGRNLVFHVYHGDQKVSELKSNNAINNHQWQHFAVTVTKNGDGRLYKNGRKVAEGRGELPRFVGRRFRYVGRSNWGADRRFAGRLDDVRVYNKALSEEEIQSLAASGGGAPGAPDADAGDADDARPPGKLAAHWPFDGNAANEAGDLNLSAAGGVTFPIENNRGAVKLDGRSGRLAADRPVALFQGDYAISLWFKTSDGKHQTILAASRHGILVELRGGVIRFLHRAPPGANDKSREIFSRGQWHDGKWHHAAAVKKGDQISLFLDGKLEAAKPAPHDLDESLDLTLGRLTRTEGKRHFNGLLRNVRLYDGAISPEQIKDLAAP